MVTWRLSFDSEADYTALKAKQATVDTLTVAVNTQTHTGAASTYNGYPVVLLPYTLLMRISDDTDMVDGFVEASVTFLRQLDSAGVAVPLT